MQIKRQHTRSQRAALIAELPVALWILFFLMTFPFLDMATVLLRYTFIAGATRDGVHAAAQSKTFFANADPSDLSATNSAPIAVNATASAFKEITINSVSTIILATNISTLQVTQYTSPLTQPANTATYLYEIKTIVKGQVNPLIVNSLLPNIPGLSAPVPVTVAATEYCEYPQGLQN